MSFEYEKITVLEEFIGKTFSKIEVGKWKDELSFHIEDKVYKFINLFIIRNVVKMYLLKIFVGI